METKQTEIPINEASKSSEENQTTIDQQVKVFKKDSMRNMILISWSFCFIILGVKIVNSFGSSLLGNLGSITVACLNFGAALSFLIIPSLMSHFTNLRFTMKLFGPEYGLYIMTYVYLIPILNCLWSMFHGFCASVLWTCETMFLAENSTDEDRGFKSGLFWGIYMIGSIVGNVFVFFYLKYVGYDPDVTTGWLGKLSILFLVFAILAFIGCIFLFLFRPVTKPKCLMSAADLQEAEAAATKKLHKEKEHHILDVFKGFVNPRIILLALPSCCWGFQYGFSNSLFNRQVIDRSIIGLVCAYNGFIQVLYSFVGGKMIDLFGHYVVFVFTNLSMIIAVILSFFANREQNWLLYLTSTFLAFGDAGYQTIIPVLITEYYKEKQTPNAVLRIFMNVANCVAYYIGIFFVEEGETRATEEKYVYECIIMVVIVILSQLSYSVFMCVYGSKKQKIVYHEPTAQNLSYEDSKKDNGDNQSASMTPDAVSISVESSEKKDDSNNQATSITPQDAVATQEINPNEDTLSTPSMTDPASQPAV